MMFIAVILRRALHFKCRQVTKVVSTSGQIPSNLAMYLDAENVPILGTKAKDIDNAEDRAKFSQMLTNNHINQPE